VRDAVWDATDASIRRQIELGVEETRSGVEQVTSSATHAVVFEALDAVAQ